MKTKKLSYTYDRGNDILYLSFGAPRPSYCDDVSEGVLARYDMETDELTGYTIIDFRKRYLANDPELLGSPIQFDYSSVAL